MVDSEQVRVLRQLARVVATASADTPLSLRMCTACVAILNVDGGSLTLAYAEPDRMPLCATDEQSAALEDIQEVLGNGPSHAAHHERRPVVVAVDSVADARWPFFATAAKEILGGPATVFALPISPGPGVMGVATFFRRGLNASLPLSEESVRLLINAVGVSLVQDPDVIDDDRQARAESWTDRAKIHQATGMVMGQLRISPDDALALLRAHAYAHTATLLTISNDILARRLDFKVDDPDPDDYQNARDRREAESTETRDPEREHRASDSDGDEDDDADGREPFEDEDDT